METKTSIDYWLKKPLYEWSSWLESLTSVLEAKYNSNK
nr:MAG TPA_asm: hypothetical protein [Caudoviricetes sp.]